MYALMSSGGKDSTLALDRARRQGLSVRRLVNIHDGRTGRVAFHGIRKELLAAQAVALDLEYQAVATGPDGFEPAFLKLLSTLQAEGFTGLVFGNIHLADVRAWYEERVRAAGLDHQEPLWGVAPPVLLREVQTRGFRATIVSVDTAQAPPDLLGREIDSDVERRLQACPAIDWCGERGEFHSYVWDGPIFSHPVPVQPGPIREERGHRLLDLTLASAPGEEPSSPR